MKHLKAITKIELSEFLNHQIVQSASRAIKSKNNFVFGISGGSLLAAIKPCNWPHKECWSILPVDERYVALDHADCNVRQMKTGAFAREQILQDRILEINPNVTIEESCKQFEGKLNNIIQSNSDEIDFIALGVGPDGHIASLFPGHNLLHEKSKSVAFLEDSPKPPAKRITITMATLLKAKTVLLYIAGVSKSKILTQVLNLDSSIPAGLIVKKHKNSIILSDAGARQED